MAKTRIQPVLEMKTKKAKKYVSTSRLFKNVGSRRPSVSGPRRRNSFEEQHAHRFVDKLGLYVSKKHAQTPDHPLAAAFSGSTYPTSVLVQAYVLTAAPECMGNSREHIQASSTAAIDAVHTSLTNRLATASAQPDSLIKAATAFKEEKLRPLGDEQLQFLTADGAAQGTASLGDRMQAFKKMVVREEKALALLGKEWADVQQEIVDFAKEVLGPNALEDFVKVSGSALGGQCGEQQKKLEQDVELDKKRLENEVEKVSQQAVQKMLAGEKVREPLWVVHYGWKPDRSSFTLGNGRFAEEAEEEYHVYVGGPVVGLLPGRRMLISLLARAYQNLPVNTCNLTIFCCKHRPILAATIGSHRFM